MTRIRSSAVITLAVMALAAQAAVGLAQTAAPSVPTLTRAEQEEFLLNAKILKTRPAGQGVTNSLRATLSDGRITHDAHVQKVDISKLEFRGTRGTELNFKDSYKYNVAGYLLDKLLDLNMVPVSVERKVGADYAAVTWWVDDFLVDEGQRRKQKLEAPDQGFYAQQMHIMRVFDQLIMNTDRNLGNLVWTTDWRLWMIDHTRAFRRQASLTAPATLLRMERKLFEKMKALDASTLEATMGRFLTKDEIKALLSRRDEIVELFTDAMAKRGEAAVMYTMAGR
jgi:hypothetical protein